MDKITKWLFPSSLITLVGSCVLSFVLLVGCSYALSRMGETGLDSKIGAIGQEVAQVSVDEAVPSIGRMVGPGVQVIATRVQGIVGQIPQISVNGTQIGVLQGPGEQGGQSGTPIATTAPQGCQQVNSPLSLQSLSLWKDGKAIEAVGILTRQGAPDDCLAVGLWKDYVKPWLTIWNQIEPNANADASTLEVLGTQCVQLNARFTPCYEATAWGTYLEWSASAEQTTALQVLHGFTLTVGPVQSTGDWSMLDDDADTRMFTVNAGPNYQGITVETVKDIQTFLSWTANRWNYGDGEQTFTVPGEPVIPVSLPDVVGPEADSYQPGAQAPAAVTPSTPEPAVTPTQQEGVGGGGEGLVVCTYPGSGSGLYLSGWAGAAPRNTSLDTVKQLNPGLWETYVQDATAPRQVNFPTGTSCGP